MISHSVEISIIGDVGEIVHAYLLVGFPFFFLLLYHVLLVKVQELICRAGYGLKKTLIPNNRPFHLFMGTIKHPKSI